MCNYTNWGRVLHSVGPATLKALSPIVHSLEERMERRCASEERSERVGV